MRGFIKILEAVIASLVILGALSYFSALTARESTWGSAILGVMARDAIHVVSKSGELIRAIKENNASKLEKLLENALPKSMMWKFVIIGLPKPTIRIGCDCTDEEMRRVKEMLHIYTSEDYVINFNGRNLTFGLLQISLENYDIDELIREIDVLLLFNASVLTENEEKVKRLLASDKGVLMVADLNESQIKNSFLSWLFGLELKSGTPSDYNNFSSLNVESKSFHISRLFTSMPVRIDTRKNKGGFFYVRGEVHNLTTGYNRSFNYEYVKVDNDPTEYREGEVFNVSDSDGNTWHFLVRQIDANKSDGRTFADISVIDENYSFFIPNKGEFNKVARNEKTILLTSNEFSSLQLNQQLEQFRGRAAWLKSYQSNFSDVNQLFKSLLLFLAGEKFTLGRDVNMPILFRTASYLFSQRYFAFPFAARIHVWYVY